MRKSASLCAILLLAPALAATAEKPTRSLPGERPYTVVKMQPEDYEITIAHPELFKPDRTPVRYKHDFHLKKLGEPSCTLCHRPETVESGFVIFDDAESKDKKLYMRRYHSLCLDCHKKRGKGPLTCGECHRAGNEFVRHKVFFEHGAHIKILSHGCYECHHKGRESRSCAECHKDHPTPEAPSLRAAAHRKCFNCHLESDEASSACVSCHGAEPAPVKGAAAHSYKLPEIVQMGGSNGIMPMAVFDHTEHIGIQQSCKGCHSFHVNTLGYFTDFREEARLCRDCHRVSGVEAAELDPSRIYHDAGLATSCVGCHRRKGKGPDGKRCSACHKGLVKYDKIHAQAGRSVVIGSLSERYEPVAFGHKAHGEMIGCNACHHRNPEGKKLACRACHAESYQFEKLEKPSLRAAYHRQCIGCHKQMGIGPVKCDACHTPKKTRR